MLLHKALPSSGSGVTLCSSRCYLQRWGRENFKTHSWDFCHLQPHCLLPQKEPFSCWRLAHVEANRRDTWAGLFLLVAQCVASPASSSRIQREQTLPLSKQLIPLKCCVLEGSASCRELALSASHVHAAEASGKLWSGVSPSSA